jgi:hypothetical protein
MPIHDLAVAYQTKTDEELLHLAENLEQLTPEADYHFQQARAGSDGRY